MKENNVEVVVRAMLAIVIFIAAIFYNPWATLKAYEIAALKYGWYTPVYWEMFGLLTLFQMLFVHNNMSLHNIWQKVKGEGTSKDAVSFAIQIPLALTIGWFIVYITL